MLFSVSRSHPSIARLLTINPTASTGGKRRDLFRDCFRDRDPSHLQGSSVLDYCGSMVEIGLTRGRVEVSIMYHASVCVGTYLYATLLDDPTGLLMCRLPLAAAHPVQRALHGTSIFLCSV